MKLNKDNKIKMIKAIKLLSLPESKQENNTNGVSFSWIERTPTEILEDIDKDKVDEELLRKLSNQVFELAKAYPKLMQEIKAKYLTL